MRHIVIPSFYVPNFHMFYVVIALFNVLMCFLLNNGNNNWSHIAQTLATVVQSALRVLKGAKTEKFGGEKSFKTEPN